MSAPSNAIVIPARNEVGSLSRVVGELRAQVDDWPIIVVDDASTDGTGTLLQRLPVHAIRLARHHGIGAALRAGLGLARSMGCSHVVRVDGDGQHPAASIPHLMDAVISGGADAAYGTRFLEPTGYDASWLRRTAQQSMATVLSRQTGRRVTDPTSGYWAFGPQALDLLESHHPDGHAEAVLHLVLHRHGLKTVEVPVPMRPRLAGRSSMTPLQCGMTVARAAAAMLWTQLQSARLAQGVEDVPQQPELSS